MADPAPKTSRALSHAKTGAKFAASWALFFWTVQHDLTFNRATAAVEDAIYRVFAGFPSAASVVDLEFEKLLEILGATFAVTLFFGTVLAVIGSLVRMVARARVRAGQKDFLDRVRAWTAAHPRILNTLLVTPAIWGTWILAHPGRWELENLDQYFRSLRYGAIPLLLGGWGMFAFGKKGVRELLAPTVGGAETESSFTISPDEIVFDAVAVTRRSVGIVTAFTAFMVLFPFVIAKLPVLELYRHGEIDLYLFAGYALFAGISAYSFRRASRVAVGLDGVHVHGTSRAQFFAYRDIDGARVSRTGDLELVRKEKVVLRLQLHGEDAARRGAVLARITENIARVREGRGAMAAQIVATSSKEDLARLARGSVDYRIANLSREQLWALVEGPEIEASARRAAAEALVRASDATERTRLRVAAERCAEPQVRIALEELVSDSEPIEARAARMGMPAGG
jgi:hypothetical protein